jgi:hypothetical protein
MFLDATLGWQRTIRRGAKNNFLDVTRWNIFDGSLRAAGNTGIVSVYAQKPKRLPRAIASHTIRLFNELKLPVLFCTSTLIEGVNTAAKTVLIYDKAINRANYDFFTYSNIRGRAGRLGQHHVGQVYRSSNDSG